MGYVVSYTCDGGRAGVKWVESEGDLEKLGSRGCRVVSVRKKEYRRVVRTVGNRVVESVKRAPHKTILPLEERVSGVITKKDVEKRILEDKLNSRLHIPYSELKRIVETSKSQPEAIRKLRLRLTGSTKYDPKYHTEEELLSALFQVKTHGYIPETHKQLEELKKSLTLGPGEYIDAEGKIHRVAPIAVPPEVVRAERNLNPPKPRPPSLPVSPPSPPGKAAITAVQRKPSFSWLIGLIGLAVLAFIFMRR